MGKHSAHASAGWRYQWVGASGSTLYQLPTGVRGQAPQLPRPSSRVMLRNVPCSCSEALGGMEPSPTGCPAHWCTWTHFLSLTTSLPSSPTGLPGSPSKGITWTQVCLRMSFRAPQPKIWVFNNSKMFKNTEKETLAGKNLRQRNIKVSDGDDTLFSYQFVFCSPVMN